MVEIIDHHRLANERTNEPIYIFAKPVGCTCTIVYQLYNMLGVEIPENLAKLMLSAILSDTVMLKSPTATDEDRQAIEQLAVIADCDWQEWGNEMFSKTATLHSVPPMEVINSDFKIYEQGKYKVGVGQVETMTLEDFSEIKDAFLDALRVVCSEKNLDWTMLLVTNVIKEESLLLMTELDELEDRLIYNKQEDNLYYLPGVMSRKKQLLPEICRVIESDDNQFSAV